MHILVVEDESRLTKLIKRALEQERHVVDVAYDGATAYSMATDTTYDLIVLDVMLPEMDGLEVCRELRREGVDSRILMLTAKGTTEDRVSGLDAGADDYLVKPFSFAELLARIRALSGQKFSRRWSRSCTWPTWFSISAVMRLDGAGNPLNSRLRKSHFSNT